MDGRKALDVQVDPRTAPAVPRVGAPAWPVAAPTDRLPIWLAAAAGLLGPAIAIMGMALEPAAAYPDAPEPLVGLVVGYALLLAWLGAAVAGLARRPAVLGWAAGIAILSVVMTVACPTTGHHGGIGAWWYAELALSLGALAATAAGLRWWAARRPHAA